MDVFIFILLAILRMVLVLNSPPILWMSLSWFVHHLYKSTKQFLTITRQTITQVHRLGPFGFNCISEYSCFMICTIICSLLKIALQCAWLPITGLLWWFRFYKNIIDDPSGRPIMDIFGLPHKYYPQQHINDERKRHSSLGKERFLPSLFPVPDSRKRHPRPFRKRFPGTPRSAPMPSCFLTINHRENRKRMEYFDIELPSTPLVATIDKMIYHIWDKHPNSEFYHNMHTILLSLWFCIGYRFWKLMFVLTSRLKSRIARLIFQCQAKPPSLWIFYKRLCQRGQQKKRSRWKRMVFTSVYNVDDKLANSNGKVVFDTDAEFVVCDNSANTHICNNKAMFVSFKETTSGMVATIGGKMNRPGGIGTVEWTWKDDSGVSHTERLDNVLYFPQSPINIMSVTEFAKQLDDEEGIGIDTKMKYSRFYWKQNQFSRKIYHSASNLPELAINEGNTLFTWFTKKFGAKVDDTINPTCCFTNHDLENHCCATMDKGDKQDDSMFVESVIYPGEKFIYKNHTV